MPRGKRAPGKTSISISVTEEFRDEIDAAAAEDNRTRSNFIVTVLERKIAERKARQSLDAGAPHASSFPLTARAPHGETPLLNEEPPKRDAVSAPAVPATRTRARRALKSMIGKEPRKP